MCKRSFIILLSIIALSFQIKAVDYYKFFRDGTMRIDYYHIGDAEIEEFTIDKIYNYKIWAGNKKSLIDNSLVGTYFIKIYDFSTNELIYSKGFNSYFGEYQLSRKGINRIKRTFHETALIPYPKKDIIFTIEKRNRKNILKRIYSSKIEINDLTIVNNLYDTSVKVFEILFNGKPDKKVDIAVIAEGYKKNEIEKFKRDLNKFKNVFLNQEPYKSRKKDFNIYGVFKPSVDSGCDEPSHGIFKNTAAGTTFYSMGSERYLLTEDNKSLRDIAGHVSYDTLFIMVNHKRYGGGGIYNFYCTFTTDNIWNSYLILHEFGHSFTGLADEYYSSDTAYNEFYPKGIEPVEPNITALLNPKKVKWEKYLTKGIEIPTKWNKTKFDKMDMAYQKIRRDLNITIAKMKREGADKKSIKELEIKSDRLSVKAAKMSDSFLKASKYANKTGVFEGAGYSSKGLYRPMLDCIMFTKGAKPYCSVCRGAIEAKIDYYTK